MTAQPEHDQRAAQAQAAGEAASAKHDSDAQAQHQVSGSTQAIEPAITPDQHAQPWFGTDNHPDGQPNPVTVTAVDEPHNL